MKTIKLLLMLFIALTACTAARSSAQDRGFGAGIIIGEPTGISIKNWISSSSAIDAGVAWSFASRTAFHIHADYLMHQFNIFDTEENIPVYYGIGGRIKIDDHDKTRLGVRMVVGLEYIFKSAPFDLFLELAPILDIAPDTKLSGNGGIGARYYF